MNCKFFLWLLIILFFSCQTKPKEEKPNDFNANPYMDAIHNSATAENPNDSSHKAEIKFLEEEFDFGIIREGDSVFHDFKFVNVGNARLLLNEVNSSCGCTLPFWPKEFIRPNDTGSIHIIFNSLDKVGDQEKPIYVSSNAKPNHHKLLLKGMVLENKQKKK